MGIITRYIVFDLLKVFIVTLSGMTALIFFVLLGKEAVDNGLGLGPLLRLLPYMLPQAMQFAVPGTMLLATTSVFGRMSAFNEVVALKSMGISPWKLAMPVLALATGVSLGAVWLSDLAVSWGRLGVERVVLESLEEVVYGQLRVNRSYANGPLSINVRRVEGRRLIQPTVNVAGSGNKSPWTISAASGEMRFDKQKHSLFVRFENVNVEGSVRVIDPTFVEQEIPLDELKGSGGRSPSTYALSEISSAIRREESHRLRLEREDASTTLAALTTGGFPTMSADAWNELSTDLSSTNSKLMRLHVEPWRRWATGFSCLCFVMVGIPVAIFWQKGEFLASFFICFCPILVVYYPLLVRGMSLAKDGSIPPPSVWMGNIVLAICGWLMMRHVARH